MTELKGRAVVDPTTARKRGVVVDVLVDATSGRLAAVDISASETEGAERIPADWIARIGHDAVMLTRSSGPGDADLIGATDDCLNYRSLVGLEVLDEGGDRVGYLQDAQVDPDSLSVTAYELSGAAWRRWLRWSNEIGSDEVTSWSRELMLIRARRTTEQVLPGILGQTKEADSAAAEATSAAEAVPSARAEEVLSTAADVARADKGRPNRISPNKADFAAADGRRADKVIAAAADDIRAHEAESATAGRQWADEVWPAPNRTRADKSDSAAADGRRADESIAATPGDIRAHEAESAKAGQSRAGEADSAAADEARADEVAPVSTAKTSADKADAASADKTRADEAVSASAEQSTAEAAGQEAEDATAGSTHRRAARH